MLNLIIGIAGTAKNTGKTTTLNAVARILRSRGCPIALTSIGYDGEDLDTITGLPKPKVFVVKGDLVATALPFIEASNAEFHQVSYTGVSSALGPTCTGVAGSDGRVVLAGPTSTEGVEIVLRAIGDSRVVLLDGALSRMSPMTLATHLILATGAARYESPSFVSEEMDILSQVLCLPRHDGREAWLSLSGGLYDPAQVTDVLNAVRKASQVHRDGERRADQGASQTDSSCEGPVIYLGGAVNPSLLSRLLSELLSKPSRDEWASMEHLTIVFHHPISLLLSGDKSLWPGVIRDSGRLGCRLAVAGTSRFLGFTVSPYIPRFDVERREFVVSYVPARPFIQEIRRLTSAPCTDIILEGPDTLRKWVNQAIG